MFIISFEIPKKWLAVKKRAKDELNYILWGPIHATVRTWVHGEGTKSSLPCWGNPDIFVPKSWDI